jgi:Na+-translocating ferredoxin:NAD+ oxidoreductase RnfE subunit
MQIRETVDSETIVYSTTSVTGGHLSLDLTLNTITIAIPASVTQNFEFTTAVYSIELYQTDGLVVPFLTGNLTLVPEVTRDD